MAEILGVGATHYPPGLVPDEYKPWPLTRMLKTDRIPAAMKDPANWPPEMQAEWGDDEGVTAHKAHRARIFAAFRQIRAEIDAFNPDFILLWGDDQYENFRDDIIPPFCVLAYDRIAFQPYHRIGDRPNIWGEAKDATFSVPGHQAAGRYLTRALIDQGVDMAYAYKPLHEKAGLGHAFANTLLFLDLDRKGFDYPVLPVAVNCYGSNVVRMRGGSEVFAAELDPPSPTPRRCFEVGQATARALKDSPWRVVLMASSSWSHAFLTAKNHWVYPDLAADRVLLAALREGRYETWRDWPLPQVEESGQQETLNWQCLVGAMAELNRRADILEWAETWSFNAPKCLAVFR